LLAYVFDANRGASHMVVLDAQNLADGPLAKAMLDHRVPYGFHGNWRDAG
jgi:carotenoid cleavage dioxygenase